MSGDTFANLLEPNLPAIRRLIQAKTRTQDYVDDMVQQTLLLAFLHRHQLRSHSKFKSWILSIAVNEVRGAARRRKCTVPLDLVQPILRAGSATCPHTAYVAREGVDQLHSGLAQLCDRDREVIHLMDLAGVTLPDAAATMSLSPAAMKSAHFRARQRLSLAVRSAGIRPARYRGVSRSARQREN